VLVKRPYEDQEDGKINFVEGGYSYGVEQIDDGRWIGTTAGGKKGLFPANCVKESTAPNEAKSITASTSAPSLITPGMRRLQRGHKKGMRKGRSVMFIQSSAGRHS